MAKFLPNFFSSKIHSYIFYHFFILNPNSLFFFLFSFDFFYQICTWCSKWLKGWKKENLIIKNRLTRKTPLTIPQNILNLIIPVKQWLELLKVHFSPCNLSISKIETLPLDSHLWVSNGQLVFKFFLH